MVQIKGKYVKPDDYYQDSYEKIEMCLETIDVKPYSETIIGCRLRSVAEKLGNKEANRLIDDLGLESYGYHKVKPYE
jgi:hypothetical protein